MDKLYKLELSQLALLQRLPYIGDEKYEWIWLMVTKLGDPKLAFIVYFPLLFAFHERGSFKLLVAASVSEFLNGVLKWLLYGERPYWLAREIGFEPALMQYPYTCETGPGSPSGHVMVSASIFYVVITLVRSSRLRLFFWVLYAIGLTLIGTSRLYIGAHFPHQLVFGAIGGMLIGHAVSKTEPSRWRPYQTLSLAGVLLVIGVVSYQGLLFFGFDPDWSIAKALKYCAKKEWIHISTTPIASLVRDISSLVGFSLCQLLNINYRLKSDFSEYGTVSFLLRLVLSAGHVALAIGLVHISDLLNYSHPVYYGSVVIANIIACLLIVVFIPFIVRKHIFTSKKQGA